MPPDFCEISLGKILPYSGNQCLNLSRVSKIKGLLGGFDSLIIQLKKAGTE